MSTFSVSSNSDVVLLCSVASQTVEHVEEIDRDAQVCPVKHVEEIDRDTEVCPVAPNDTAFTQLEQHPHKGCKLYRLFLPYQRPLTVPFFYGLPVKFLV